MKFLVGAELAGLRREGKIKAGCTARLINKKYQLSLVRHGVNKETPPQGEKLK